MYIFMSSYHFSAPCLLRHSQVTHSCLRSCFTFPTYFNLGSSTKILPNNVLPQELPNILF